MSRKNKKRQTNRNNKVRTNSNTEMSSKKKASYVIPIIAFLIPIIALIYTTSIDYISGKWGGKIELTIKEYSFKNNQSNYVFYPIPDICLNKKILIPVEFQVYNNRNEPDDEVVISFKYKRENHREYIPEYLNHAFGANLNKHYSHEINIDKMFVYSNSLISYIPELGKFLLTDAAFSSPVKESDNIVFPAKNGLDVDIIVHSKKTNSKEWKLLYRGLHANNKNYFLKTIFNTYVHNISVDKIYNTSYSTYLYKLFLSDDINMYATILNFKDDNINNICIPEEQYNEDGKYGIYKVIAFNPYTWKNLWFKFKEDYLNNKNIEELKRYLN